MSQSIPQPVRLLLDEYLRLLNATLPDLAVGMYLHGSLALGAFDPRWSDIDFITVTSRRCTSSDIDTLRGIHEILAEREGGTSLEGSYVPRDDLGQLEDVIPPHPHVHDGVFHASGYHDINYVTWWVLKHHGIAVFGPPPKQYAIEIDWDDLLARMHQNLDSYWARFTTDPRRIAWLLSDYGIQWTVLGVLRQFYTFREHSIISKTVAGEYALAHLPQKWHRLIHEAIAIRAGSRVSSYRSRLVRAVVARTFLQCIITACKTRPGD